MAIFPFQDFISLYLTMQIASNFVRLRLDRVQQDRAAGNKKNPKRS